MAEGTTIEPVVSEPSAELAPVQSEPAVKPAVVEEISTAQPVEPLNREPIPEPQMASEPLPKLPTTPIEPISTPEPQPSQTPPEPISEPISTPSTDPGQATTTPIPEPAPAPRPQVSTPPIIQTSLARELLVKARGIIQFRKSKKLDKIMSLFLKKQNITNDDVQKLLYVSDATATRYLDQLEREGKIREQGSIGHKSYSRI